MQHFDSDYMEGTHPSILKRLTEINMEKNPGYGTDDYCSDARSKIRSACDCPAAEVYFMVGGTQTNSTVINGLLHNWQGVLATDTSHINNHEAGAIEHSGHKVLALPHQNGKLTAQNVKDYLERFYNDETWTHMVEPGMVYISHPTEYGTLYTLKELQDLREICTQYHLPLYMDGARLGYGLMARGSDVTLKDIARLCDVFYIGGTKVGALFGEAVVIPRPDQIPHYFTQMKQQGGLLAKGWLLGLQFDTLFTDDLYLDIAGHAIDMAMKLRNGLVQKGYRLYMDSPTNQQFIILSDEKLAEISAYTTYSFWEKPDSSHTVIRFATSWATLETDVDALLAVL